MKRSEVWTVQFFPDDGGEVRSVRLRPAFAYAGVGAISALVALLFAWLFGFLGERHATAELERLRAENRQLVASLETMEGRSSRLAEALDGLAARDQRYRVLAGLPLLDRDVYAVGVGGPAPLEAGGEGLFTLGPALAASARSTSRELDQLLRRAELLAVSLEEAADSLATRRDAFETRPSIFPVSAPGSWISSGFSYNRLHPLLGYRRPHPGIDISAPLGSPVVTTAAGRIVSAKRTSGYGRVVEVDHGNGYRTRYAHLAGIRVRPGQRVDRGETLGEVGRSGLATGPNLHYEVLVDDRHVNPWSYLLDRR